MAALIKGADLNEKQRQQVLNAFPYRHIAIGPGLYYPTEQAWLNDHAFWIRKDGGLADNRHRAEPHYMATREPPFVETDDYP